MDRRGGLPANHAMPDPIPLLRSERPAAAGWRAPTAAALALSFFLVAAAAGAAHALRGLIPAGSIALVFLIAVLLSAVRFGFWTGIGSAALAFLAYNFFFVDPVMTLRVASFEDVLALGVFLLVAGLSGSLAGRLREQATAAQERARLLEHLCDLSAALGSAATEPEAREATRQGLQRLTGSDAIFLDRGLSTNPPLAVDDMQAAERALRRGKVEAAAASGWSEGRYDFHPVIAGGDAPLVVGVAPGAASDEQEKAVRTAVEQAGAAIRRLRLADEADEARRKAERESIRAALLSSLSHDLKTPLATILGSVTTLRQFSATLPEAARTDLLRAIEEEARRLNIYVGNLLQMTRLQSGIDARLDWAEPRDILQGAVGRLRQMHPDRTMVVAADPDLPLVRTDAILLEQALFNCLDNAAAIAPQGTPIRVAIAMHEGRLLFTVEDEGPGVDPAEQERIFEPFQRGSAAAANGTGLGLAIARGILHALGGAIGVVSPLTGKGGARFWLAVPSGEGPRP